MTEIVIPCAIRMIRPPDGRAVISDRLLTDAFITATDIWAQAEIKLELIDLETVDEGYPRQMLAFVTEKVFQPDAVAGACIIGYSTTWNLPSGSQDYSGNHDKNGFANPPTRAFAVKTSPELHDVSNMTTFSTPDLVGRVIAHEIGHLFGLVGDGVLAHYNHEPSRMGELMFSGTNGTMVNDVQIPIARKTALTLIGK